MPASPSKATLPKKPAKPRETKDAALYAQRQAEYQRLLAVYEQEKAAYDAGQRRRRADKAAAERQEAKAAAGEAQAPTCAKPEPSSAPSPTVGPTAAAVQAKEPTARQLAAAVVPSSTGGELTMAKLVNRDFGGCVLGSNGDLVDPTDAVRQHPAFAALDPARRAKQNAWSEAVALLAEQAGFLTAPQLYGCGKWCAVGEPDYDLEYLPSHREAQLSRLRGHGRPPTAAELAHLRWPHSGWWDDRDRIVLLHEYMLHSPPDGSFQWEHELLRQVCCLWSEGRAPCSRRRAGDKALAGRMHWLDFADDEAPGWRMLGSLPSCPNAHMSFPLSRDLLQRIADRDSVQRVRVDTFLLDVKPSDCARVGLRRCSEASADESTTFLLDVKPSDSIASLRAKIQDKEDIPCPVSLVLGWRIPGRLRRGGMNGDVLLYNLDNGIPPTWRLVDLEDDRILADYISNCTEHARSNDNCPYQGPDPRSYDSEGRWGRWRVAEPHVPVLQLRRVYTDEEIKHDRAVVARERAIAARARARRAFANIGCVPVGSWSSWRHSEARALFPSACAYRAAIAAAEAEATAAEAAAAAVGYRPVWLSTRVACRRYGVSVKVLSDTMGADGLAIDPPLKAEPPPRCCSCDAPLDPEPPPGGLRFGLGERVECFLPCFRELSTRTPSGTVMVRRGVASLDPTFPDRDPEGFRNSSITDTGWRLGTVVALRYSEPLLSRSYLPPMVPYRVRL